MGSVRWPPQSDISGSVIIRQPCWPMFVVGFLYKGGLYPRPADLNRRGIARIRFFRQVGPAIPLACTEVNIGIPLWLFLCRLVDCLQIYRERRTYRVALLFARAEVECCHESIGKMATVAS